MQIELKMPGISEPENHALIFNEGSCVCHVYGAEVAPGKWAACKWDGAWDTVAVVDTKELALEALGVTGAKIELHHNWIGEAISIENTTPGGTICLPIIDMPEVIGARIGRKHLFPDMAATEAVQEYRLQIIRVLEAKIKELDSEHGIEYNAGASRVLREFMTRLTDT